MGYARTMTARPLPYTLALEPADPDAPDRGAIARVTLTAPRLGWATLDALAALPAALTADRRIRAVIVTHAGPDFSHGADLADPALAEALRDDGGHLVSARGARLLDAWAALPMPTLAVIRGRAIGGGVGLALACDFRHAAPDATFAVPEVLRGMHLGWGIIPRLVATFGLPLARHLALGGGAVRAADCPPYSVHLADDPDAAALDHARHLAAASPAAIGHIKATLGRAIDLGLAGDDAARFARSVAHPDFTAGLTAWATREPPRFHPRPDPQGDAMKTIDDVLRYWFGPYDDDREVIANQGKIWFGGGPALDAEIREQFGDLVDEAIAGGLGAWSETPRGNLARIILLDQFTRNVHRDSPKAFAGDPTARALTQHAIERGDEAELRPIERVFLYMPLEHSEDPALQAQCVARFEALAAEAPEGLTETMQGYLRYAERHRVIIDRFGRFPHRNGILGRTSTPEEKAYLEDGGETFGTKQG